MTNIGRVSKFVEFNFADEIKSHNTLSATCGDFVQFPESINANLTKVLTSHGIRSLYSHQNDAFESINRGEDTILVSQTASGKTLSFFLPILNNYISAKPPFSVLFLYPTKALSRDQEGTLGELMHAVTDNLKIGTFDGDTPVNERSKIQQTADFVITNPDMLHSGILPNHNRKWKAFLSRLKYIVIDEVHTYRGAFGSHISNVFRRLLRVCAIHGSNPSFICSSATIGNPGEHVNTLFDREFTVIDQDGAPRPERKIYFINPNLINSGGYVQYRKGTGSVSVPLIRYAIKNSVRTICFCRARQQVERLYRAVIDGHPELKSKVKPYRGGLLPNERRKLERDLFDGKINTIISTNALELGIDIGDLDLCILSGHPGSIASFWQQTGRVGRKSSKAIIVFIAKDSPIDQYLVNYPEYITNAPVEQAWLNANNPYIIMQHLPCAAYEHPLREHEKYYGGQVYDQAVEVLKENKVLAPYREYIRYADSDYPAKGVNLRGMTDYNIEIYCKTEVIGELDPIGARGTLYKDAIYQHLGRRYMSLDLDLEKKLCKVAEVNVDYYTEAVWESRITMNDIEESRGLNNSKIAFGYINVNKQPKLFKKIRERTFENIGYGPITLDPFEYDTTGFSILPPVDWQNAMEKVDKRYVNAALYGLSYILKKTAPSLCMGDVKDIDTDVSLMESKKDSWKSALYLFDTHEGGVGYAEKIYEKIDDSINFCQKIIEECECKFGCPSCVTPIPPGIDNKKLEDLLVESNATVMCTKSLITKLLIGTVVIPEISQETSHLKPSIEQPTYDEDAKKLNARLKQAAKIMKKKREKVH